MPVKAHYPWVEALQRESHQKSVPRFDCRVTLSEVVLLLVEARVVVGEVPRVRVRE